ncbi:MAG: helix-turn-helix domain-containing protein [Anaerolineae bacterium]|nr:helix-turn-helix domain-containing protein [Anaerolineae bacterium]
MNELTQFVSAYLDEHNISQRQLSLAIGVSNATINRVLQTGAASADTLEKLAAYCRHDLTDLYRMAGRLPEEESAELRIGRQVAADLDGLPEEDQEELLIYLRAMADAKRKLNRQRED